MSNNYKRVSMKVYGKVQGVFFRASTQQKARELGLKGFVQNELDGTVYLEAEGDPETIAQLEAWAHHGPERAKVEKVEVTELDSLVRFKEFKQRR